MQEHSLKLQKPQNFRKKPRNSDHHYNINSGPICVPDSVKLNCVIKGFLCGFCSVCLWFLFKGNMTIAQLVQELVLL